MDRETVAFVVGNLLRKEARSDFTPETKIEDLGISSLILTEISMGIEDAFGIEEFSFWWEGEKTVDEIVDRIMSKIGR